MLLRIIILFAFCIIMYVAYLVITKWQLSKAGTMKEVDPILAGADLSIPTIVYFTTPMCVTCRTTQRPAFDRLKEKIQNVNIIKVDSYEDPESSKRWGVLSVPTTFVIDAAGNPVKVNNGFVDEHKLSKQLQLVHNAA